MKVTNRSRSLGGGILRFGAGCHRPAAGLGRASLRPGYGYLAEALTEIRDNLTACIDEARREGWLGEMEGLEISLAGAQDKLAQISRRQSTTTTSESQQPSPARPAQNGPTKQICNQRIGGQELGAGIRLDRPQEASMHRTAARARPGEAAVQGSSVQNAWPPGRAG